MGVPPPWLILTCWYSTLATSTGTRTQPCEAGLSGMGTSPWMAKFVPMKNTGLYIRPSATCSHPATNRCAR